MISKCLLCDAPLEPREDGYQDHPPADDCSVTLTDAFGISVDEAKSAVPTSSSFDNDLNITFFPTVDEVLIEMFAAAGVPRLGGESTGRGWSSFSKFQRCPYLWFRDYVIKAKPPLFVESPGRAIGSLVHVFLAVFYTRMTDTQYPLTPEDVHAVVRRRANPKFVEEAWRVFIGYKLFYQNEEMVPLAIEHALRDPRTGESCRYDLITYYAKSIQGRPAGTYIMEHKTSGRFDQATLDGWGNDGEVIGQVALWQHLGLDKRFGKLQGVIVNILGKQKVPQYHRTYVAPESWQIESHLDDLRRWEGQIQLALATNNFPRARAGCIGKFGMCEHWDHCLTREG